MTGRPSSWSVVAVNLPEHADNAVHTDAGARAAGHERALVAGTTVYSYLTRPAAAAWGVEWVAGGRAEVRFRSPVFDGDLVTCDPTEHSGGVRIAAEASGETRATLDVSLDRVTPLPMRGDRLPDLELMLDEELAGYGMRTGDDLALYERAGIVAPVIWPIIGNRATMASVVDGPWIHVRSSIVHCATVAPGDEVVVESSLAERFQSRAGERAVLDVRARVRGRLVAAIEHESIVRVAPRS